MTVDGEHFAVQTGSWLGASTLESELLRLFLSLSVCVSLSHTHIFIPHETRAPTLLPACPPFHTD